MAARATERFTDLAVRRMKRPGVWADGRGLYLQVIETGAKSWLYRFKHYDRERWMGLGPYPDVSLAAARAAALRCRELRRQGVDPIEQRRAEQAAARVAAAKSLNFRSCASAYVAAHKAGWRNPKHAAQWTSTLDTYVHPVMGDLAAADIDTALVLKVLEPVWSAKPETATRVRQRMEAVLDWATARGYRTGENPARWRGHLDKLLPKRSKVQRVQHHVAMPYADIPDFFAALRSRRTWSARALCFTILTAARSSEVRGAAWSEVDLANGVWTVPAERTKAHRPHRVPLSHLARAVLREAREARTGDCVLVFPGERHGRPMSENTMRKYLQEDMGYAELTVHGFRSSFRDWAGERTNVPREVAEAALAHVVRDKTEAAYARGDLFDRRRKLMEAWSRFCSSTAARGGDPLVGQRSEACDG